MARTCEDANSEAERQLRGALNALVRGDYEEFDRSIERAKKIGEGMHAVGCQVLGTSLEVGVPGIKHIREKRPL